MGPDLKECPDCGAEALEVIGENQDRWLVVCTCCAHVTAIPKTLPTPKDVT